MDGTFKSAPKIYTQLYTINVPIRSQWFPVVFVLMENKTKKSYELLLRILKEEVDERLHRPLSPRYVSTDYEIGAMNAAREAFPVVTIAGCLFYLGQNFWRRLQAEGLMEAYQDEGNSELRAQFRNSQ